MLREDETTPGRSLTTAALLLAMLLAALTALSMPARADAAGTRLDNAERALLREINRTRHAHGVSALRPSRRLQRSADYHCWDMLHANFFAHTSSNGTPFERRVERYTRKRRLGENLAYTPTRKGDRAARQVVQMWLDSPAHRAALLSPVFRRVGLARRIGKLGADRMAVYTADFASKR